MPLLIGLELEYISACHLNMHLQFRSFLVQLQGSLAPNFMSSSTTSLLQQIPFTPIKYQQIGLHCFQHLPPHMSTKILQKTIFYSSQWQTTTNTLTALTPSHQREPSALTQNDSSIGLSSSQREPYHDPSAIPSLPIQAPSSQPSSQIPLGWNPNHCHDT
jgi:hypothetical protein